MIAVVFFSTAVQSANTIPVKFRNNSVETINLYIPGLPNPTLAPNTVMGAELVKGQKIFFTYQGTQYLLLTVTEKMENKRVDLDALIQKRIKQIERI